MLPEEVHAVARHVRNLVREVDVIRLNELLPHFRRRDRFHHLGEISFGDGAVADRLHESGRAEHRRTPDCEMKIRRAAVVHQLEKAVNLVHREPPWERGRLARMSREIEKETGGRDARASRITLSLGR